MTDQERIVAGAAEWLAKLAKCQRDSAVRILADGEAASYTPMLSWAARKRPDAEPETTLAALVVPFNTAAEKRGALRHLGRDVYKAKSFPLAACLATEAWVSEQPAGEPRRYARPADDPGRKEVIIVFGQLLTLDGGHAWSLPVRRDERNRMHVAGDWRDMPGAATPLLEEFFKGFLETLAARLGVQL